MAKTSVSSATAYASAADLLNAYGAAGIGDWATDGRARLTPAQILTDTIVAAALLRASGEVEHACLRGGKYTAADLAALAGASAAALKGLVCDIAAYRIAKRRLPVPNAEEVSSYKEARETLKALNEGAEIFSLQETIDAGTGPSTADLQYDSANRVNRPTEMARRLFGSRMDQYPLNVDDGE